MSVRLEPRLVSPARGVDSPTDQLVVSYYATLDAEKVIADLQARGVVIIAHRDYSRQLDIVIDPARLDEIIALPFLQFLGPAPEEPVLEGYDHRNATGRSNYLNTGYNGLNYNGAGVVVGIGEGGTVDNLVDVKGRLTEMDDGRSRQSQDRGDAERRRGGQPGPDQPQQCLGRDLPESWKAIPDYAALYASHNLRYTNHSYGVAISGGYDSDRQGPRSAHRRLPQPPGHLFRRQLGRRARVCAVQLCRLPCRPRPVLGQHHRAR